MSCRFVPLKAILAAFCVEQKKKCIQMLSEKVVPAVNSTGIKTPGMVLLCRGWLGLTERENTDWGEAVRPGWAGDKMGLCA